ncbi:unnamed protein product [Arctia plantaginis]|uniref:G-protein coupled receptors family 2 profile 2 domain-containing protein n=1 Tax=Arctia plantaginis TaxID=874455 RepID=A0A8S1BQY8_ARCPL|nr:unnamed protein product [Arctia plantaginis]
MERAVILFGTVLLTCSIQIGGTLNNDTDIEPTDYPGEGMEDDNVPFVPCSGPNCIYKCCSHGECIRLRQCVPCDAGSNFSAFIVYDENIVDIGKRVPDIFHIVPEIYKSKEEFQDSAVNVYQIEFNPYIIKTGELILEAPNSYHRWITVQRDYFCVDYFITKKGKLINTPKIWAIVEGEEYPESDISLTAATLVSCFFLLLVLVVYFLLPELQNLCGMILMAYVGSLFMAFLLLATIQLDRYEDNACIGLTMGIYYFFLASFCWMSVMSYDIWWTFRGYAKARPIHRRGESFKFLMYCLYAWGVPLLMTIFIFVVNTIDMSHMPWFITPNVPGMGCFLEGGNKMLYLYIPMLILIVCNWMFYLMTAFNVWRLSRGTAVLDSAAAGTPAAHRSQRNRLMVYLKLSVVMGVNWVFEIISFKFPGFKGWYISDVYNILIGFLIFLIFVCKKDIYRKLYKRYALHPRRFYPGSVAGSRSYSSTSSDSNPETTTLQICANPKGFNGY